MTSYEPPTVETYGNVEQLTQARNGEKYGRQEKPT